MDAERARFGLMSLLSRCAAKLTRGDSLEIFAALGAETARTRWGPKPAGPQPFWNLPIGEAAKPGTRGSDAIPRRAGDVLMSRIGRVVH